MRVKDEAGLPPRFWLGTGWMVVPYTHMWNIVSSIELGGKESEFCWLLVKFKVHVGHPRMAIWVAAGVRIWSKGALPISTDIWELFACRGSLPPAI